MNSDNKKMVLKVQGPESDLRRWIVTKDLTYDALVVRVSSAFELGGSQYLIKYKDSDGDAVSITNEEEWRDSLEFAEGDLLRVSIHKTQAPAAPSCPTVTVDLPFADLPQVTAFANQLRSFQPELAPTIDAVLPAVEQAMQDAKELFEGGIHQAQDTFNNAIKATHHGVVCDGCSMAPLVGHRFKCTSLPDYDLCEECHAKWKADPANAFPSTDAESTWNQMEQPLPHPADFLRGWKGAGCGGGKGWRKGKGKGCWGGMKGGKGGRGFGGEGCPMPAMGQWMAQAMAAGKGMGAGEGEGSSSAGPFMQGFPGPMGHWMAQAMGGKGKGKGGCTNGWNKDLRFVGDETLLDGVEVAPGQALTKIWKVRNTGDITFPEGTHLLPNGGDDLQAKAHNPPLLAPQEEGNITVDITTPTKPGRYVGYFKMAGPRGRPFGQRLWVDIRVTDPEQSEAASVEAFLNAPEEKPPTPDADQPEEEKPATSSTAAANPFEAMFEGTPPNMDEMLREMQGMFQGSEPNVQEAIKAVTQQNPGLMNLVEGFLPGVGAMIAAQSAPAAPAPAAPAAAAPAAAAPGPVPVPSPAAREESAALTAFLSSPPPTPPKTASPAESEDEFELVQEESPMEKGKGKQAEGSLERSQMLDMLKEMGFADEEVNRMTLDAVGGSTGDALARTVVRLSNLEESLRQLQLMGFMDAHKNAALLLEHDNSLKAVLEILMGNA